MITLYRAPFSTNVVRVALALAHKGLLEVESIVIDYDDRSEVERVSGQGLVPVIDYDGTIVVDSMQILLWLEQRHPEPALYPAVEARRAEMLVFIDWFNRVWKGPPNEIEAELRGGAAHESPRIVALAEEMSASLDLFEAMLAGRDYLMGDFSAADCAAYPFLRYGLGRDAADVDLFHEVLERYLALGDAHPRLARWIRRVDKRPRV